jgi:hypothetical protein
LWWTESGFDTDGRGGGYFGVSTGIARCAYGSEAEQAVRIEDVLQQARSNPHIAGAFNFLLYDERDRGRWQSASCGPTALRSLTWARFFGPSVER